MEKEFHHSHLKSLPLEPVLVTSMKYVK